MALAEKGPYESQLRTKKKLILSNSRIKSFRGMDGWMQRFFSSNLLHLWLDPSVLQVSEEIIKALHALRWLLHRERCFTVCLEAQALKFSCNAARFRVAKIWERNMMFARTHCSCGLFEFTPRKNTILNIGGTWFALMFLWTFCKELEFSYFVAQPHGFKRQT